MCEVSNINFLAILIPTKWLLLLERMNEYPSLQVSTNIVYSNISVTHVGVLFKLNHT